MDKKSLNRYLDILGLTVENLSVQYLEKIVSAHLQKFKFENISKLYYLNDHGQRNIPDLNQYLDGIEQYHFGGTCYSNNYYLNLLLKKLGFDIILCGADMNEPDVHIVSIVKIRGREYIVDVGYGAPFYRPIPRDLCENHELINDRDKYVHSPKDKSGNTQMTMYRDGNYLHGYKIKPNSREIDYFNEVIKDSYQKYSTFMNSILLVRFWPDHFIRLHNYKLMEISPKESMETDIPKEQLPDIIEKIFEIPKKITITAMKNLRELQSPWS